MNKNDSAKPVGVTYEEWRNRVEKDLEGVPFEKKLVSQTPEGVAVQPLYRAEDIANLGSGAKFLRASRKANGEWMWKATNKPEGGCICRDNALDPIGALLLKGELAKSLEANYDEMANRVKSAPEGMRPVAIASMLVHEAGGTAVQELGFALATAVEYVRELGKRGVPAEKAVAGMLTNFALGVDFFMEVSKIRAHRLLWAKMAEAWGVAEAGRTAFVGALTAFWDKTIYDHHVNLLRLTTQAMSGVVGGCDSLLIRPFDGTETEPSELGLRMSANLHEMLANEFLLASVVDPAGGSYYVEKLTEELAQKAWALFQEIEGKGGLAACVKSGYVQSLVEASAKDKQKLVDSRRRVFLGTTLQPNLKDEIPAVDDTDCGCKAVEAPAEKATKLVRRRGAEAFEEVRRAGDEFAKKNGGKRASVFLARMGTPKQSKARADFSTGFLTIGGFEIAKGESGFTTGEAAAEAAAKSGAVIAVICATDDMYLELAPAFAKKLKAIAPKMKVLLAGAPGANEAAWKEAGFDEFINVRSNVRTTLAQLQKATGVVA